MRVDSCTYNIQGNEQNAAWLARAFALEPLHLKIPND